MTTSTSGVQAVLKARQVKASSLARVFLERNATAEQVANLDDEGWTVASQIAGVYPPSNDTRRMVIDFLSTLEIVQGR